MTSPTINKLIDKIKNRPLTYEGFTFDQQFLDNFNAETDRVHPLLFNEFVNDKAVNGQSLIDILLDLEKEVQWQNVPLNINKRMSDETGKKLVLEFFDGLGLRSQAEEIIEGKNPMFETHILKKANRGSAVEHIGENPKIDFYVDLNGTLEGVSTLAHELSHALCGHYVEMAKLIKEQNEIIETYGNPSKELEDFKHNKFDKFMQTQTTYAHDSICEIESHIIEKLFMKFLLDKNTITQEDEEIFLQGMDDSFRKNLKVIFEENTIYSEIRKIKAKTNNKDEKITADEFKKLHKKLNKTHHYNDHMHKLIFISRRSSPKVNEQRTHSQHRLRYVIAQIVSTVWLDRYNKSNTQDKQEMIKNFKEYLLNSEKYDISNILDTLMPGTKIEDIIDEFKQIHQAKNNQIIP